MIFLLNLIPTHFQLGSAKCHLESENCQLGIVNVNMEQGNVNLELSNVIYYFRTGYRNEDLAFYHSRVIVTDK